MANIIVEIPIEYSLDVARKAAKEYDKVNLGGAGIIVRFGPGFSTHKGRAKVGDYVRVSVMNTVKNACQNHNFNRFISDVRKLKGK